MARSVLRSVLPARLGLGGRKRGQGGPGGIGNARPIEALTGLQLRLGAEFGVAGIHGGSSLAVAQETLSILAARGESCLLAVWNKVGSCPKR